MLDLKRVTLFAIYTSFDRAGRALVDMEKLVDREQPNDVYTFFIREQ